MLHNKEIKKWFILVITTLIILSMFAACAGETPPETLPEEADPVEEVETRETVTLVFLTEAWDVQQAAWAEIAEEFKKIEDGRWSYVEIQNDAVPIEQLYPKIAAAAAAGAEAYDVVTADGPDIKHLAHMGAIIPLTEYFTEEEMQLWWPESVMEATYKGEFYGPPAQQSCSMMMYNVEMVEAAGVSPPAELANSWTMEEALVAWQKTTVDTSGDGVPNVWGFDPAPATAAHDYGHGTYKRSAGEPGSPTFEAIGADGITFVGYTDTPEAIEAMEFYQALFQEYQVTPVEAIESIFEQQLSAFMVTPDNRIGVLSRMYGGDENVFEWGVTGHPYFVTQLCHTGSWHYSISPSTQNLEEAVAFIRFLGSDQAARIFYKHVRQLPANINVFNELPEYLEGGRQHIWYEAMQSVGVPRVQTPCYSEYNQLFMEHVANIQAGANVAEQLSQLAQNAEAVCAKYGE